ncbi:unnamed protein product [Schistosoma turkestanicum]|nr:unnamed protein product [Schistosoma turkestanicum]
MNQALLNDNSFSTNRYNIEACQENDSCTLFNINPNCMGDIVNRTNMEGEMFSQWRYALNVIIIALQILSAIFIFCGNLLVILAVTTSKRLRRITDLYIVSLALADLLVAVLVLPLSIMRQVYGYWPYESHELCIYWLSLNVLLCSASILNLCCISVDRYIAINYPMKYYGKRTRQTALAMIGGAWTVSLLFMIPPIFGYQHHTGVGQCYVRSDIGYRFFTGIAAFFTPFLLVTFIYIRIFWVIRHRSKEFEFGKFPLDPKEHRYGSFKLLFSPNRIYNHHFVRIKRYFSSISSNQRHSFGPNDRQSNLCVPCTPHKRHEDGKECDVNQSPVRNPSSLCFNEVSEQMEREDSDTSRQHTQYIQMSRVPMLHRTTKSDLNHFSTSVDHGSTDNTETCNSPTTDTNEDKFNTDFFQSLDKTVDTSVNDPQNGQQKEHQHTLISQNKQNVNHKSKHPNTHNKINFNQREYLVFKREQKTAKTVGTVVCCFILCWLPFTTLYFLEGAYECLFSERIYSSTAWAAYLNSMCNPFIYAFCNKKYAKAFKHLLHIENSN